MKLQFYTSLLNNNKMQTMTVNVLRSIVKSALNPLQTEVAIQRIMKSTHLH